MNLKTNLKNFSTDLLIKMNCNWHYLFKIEFNYYNKSLQDHSFRLICLILITYFLFWYYVLISICSSGYIPISVEKEQKLAGLVTLFWITWIPILILCHLPGDGVANLFYWIISFFIIFFVFLLVPLNKVSCEELETYQNSFSLIWKQFLFSGAITLFPIVFFSTTSESLLHSQEIPNIIEELFRKNLVPNSQLAPTYHYNDVSNPDFIINQSCRLALHRFLYIYKYQYPNFEPIFNNSIWIKNSCGYISWNKDKYLTFLSVAAENCSKQELNTSFSRIKELTFWNNIETANNNKDLLESSINFIDKITLNSPYKVFSPVFDVETKRVASTYRQLLWIQLGHDLGLHPEKGVFCLDPQNRRYEWREPLSYDNKRKIFADPLLLEAVDQAVVNWKNIYCPCYFTKNPSTFSWIAGGQADFLIVKTQIAAVDIELSKCLVEYHSKDKNPFVYKKAMENLFLKQTKFLQINEFAYKAVMQEKNDGFEITYAKLRTYLWVKSIPTKFI